MATTMTAILAYDGVNLSGNRRLVLSDEVNQSSALRPKANAHRVPIGTQVILYSVSGICAYP